MQVYEYTVYWHERFRVPEWQWKRTAFARKKDAKQFAKKQKVRGVKPHPYIIRTIVPDWTYRTNVKLERARKNAPARKFIRY